MLIQNISRRNFMKTTGIAGMGSMVIKNLDAQSQTDGDDGKAETGKLSQTYRFHDGSAGLLPCFTDYTIGGGDNRFLAEVRELPAEVQVRGNRNAYYIQCQNRPDDLFMFFKGVLNTAHGVETNQAYLISFDLSFASKSNNCIGVGGAVSSVWLKAGGSTVEPLPQIEASGYISINVDKGSQSVGGQNLGSLGSIWNGVECPASQWVLLRRSYDHPVPIRSSSHNELWIAFGVESGYESLTGVYFHSIKVTLRPVEGG